jgi:quinoprotein glucose dehydrogenase
MFKRARYDGPLTPPGVTPYIQFPGFLGGMNWWGVSVNPERLLMIVNVNRVATYNHLIPRAEADRLGIHPMQDGRGDVGGTVAQAGTPFAAAIGPFLSPLYMPCQAPPYGTISAVDLRTQKLVWTQRLGTAASNGPLGIPSHLPILMGTPNMGGSMSTRGGLTFIAATPDRYLRAYESTTGLLRWSDRLPAGGHSTPMSYRSASGRQMVVIAAAGARSFGSRTGDYIIAYALPSP